MVLSVLDISAINMRDLVNDPLVLTDYRQKLLLDISGGHESPSRCRFCFIRLVADHQKNFGWAFTTAEAGHRSRPTNTVGQEFTKEVLQATARFPTVLRSGQKYAEIPNLTASGRKSTV